MPIARDAYPPGVPCWVDTWQPDVDAAATFYGGLFGWEFEERLPGGEVSYRIARLHGLQVAAVGSLPPGASQAAWNTYVAVEDVDAVAAAARAAGGSVLAGPFDVGDAGRMAALADPSGAEFSIWRARGRTGAELVNAAGSWNWSNLLTTDMPGSASFYGAVFGWHADAMSFGEDESAMLRLPGYGEFLAQRDPDLRRRHAEAHVPPSFSDAIGWMLAAGDEPHWSVTFAVDDPDSIAARAADLGGCVVVAPYDVGPVRLGVLRDPQDAEFTVSRYTPPA